ERWGGEVRNQLVGRAPRPARAVDQEHLLLGADPAHAGLEAVLVEHALERVHVGEDRLHECAQLLVGERALDVVSAHWSRGCGTYPPRRRHALLCREPPPYHRAVQPNTIADGAVVTIHYN